MFTGCLYLCHVSESDVWPFFLVHVLRLKVMGIRPGFNLPALLGTRVSSCQIVDTRHIECLVLAVSVSVSVLQTYSFCSDPSCPACPPAKVSRSPRGLSSFCWHYFGNTTATSNWFQLKVLGYLNKQLAAMSIRMSLLPSFVLCFPDHPGPFSTHSCWYCKQILRLEDVVALAIRKTGAWPNDDPGCPKTTSLTPLFALDSFRSAAYRIAGADIWEWCVQRNSKFLCSKYEIDNQNDFAIQVQFSPPRLKAWSRCLQAQGPPTGFEIWSWGKRWWLVNGKFPYFVGGWLSISEAFPTV